MKAKPAAPICVRREAPVCVICGSLFLDHPGRDACHPSRCPPSHRNTCHPLRPSCARPGHRLDSDERVLSDEDLKRAEAEGKRAS